MRYIRLGVVLRVELPGAVWVLAAKGTRKRLPRCGQQTGDNIVPARTGGGEIDIAAGIGCGSIGCARAQIISHEATGLVRYRVVHVVCRKKADLQLLEEHCG